MKSLAIITGGAQRLGKAFALSMARRGYSLLLHYFVSEEDVRSTVDEIRSLCVDVFPVQADLTDPGQIRSIFSTLEGLQSTHQLKLLVNSAAIMPMGNPRELELKDWDSALELNLRAPFLLAQEAVKWMRGGGLIVNVTDSGAHKTWSRYPSYVVSKSALESLTKLLARSFAPQVRVNAIAPGLVLPSSVVSKEQWNKLVERLPLRRAGTLDEVTAALEFLVDNGYVTGQTLAVDGGYSLI